MTPGIREAKRVSTANVNDTQSSHTICWECIPYLSDAACFLLLGSCIVVRSCREVEAEVLILVF